MSIVYILYMAAPAFAANMAPVFAARFHFLQSLGVPIHQAAFGPNKTWRGFVVGVGAAVVVVLTQWMLGSSHVSDFFFAMGFGVTAGLGALLGDLIKSFFKRRLGIQSGKPFIPFDYIDYMIGFLVLTYPLYTWTGMEAVSLILCSLVANPLANLLGYTLGIKNTYW